MKLLSAVTIHVSFDVLSLARHNRPGPLLNMPCRRSECLYPNILRIPFKRQEQGRGQDRVQKTGWNGNYKLCKLLLVGDVEHFAFGGGRLGISHFHLHVKVNLPLKQTAVEWKVPGRLMRCAFPLFHTSLLFIPLFVCAGCGSICVGSAWGGPMG